MSRIRSESAEPDSRMTSSCTASICSFVTGPGLENRPNRPRPQPILRVAAPYVCGMSVRISLGGEGEDEGVLNINLLRLEGIDLTRLARARATERATRTGRLIRATAAALPLRGESALDAIARHFPVQDSTTLDGRPIQEVFLEVFRVLVPAGLFTFERSSRSSRTDRDDGAGMAEVGFSRIRISVAGVIGEKG
jgi:hypothetical protein